MSISGNLTAQVSNLPIRRKLRVIFLLTTGFALLLAGFGIVITDSLMFYNYLQRDLVTFVTIIGDTSTAALAFDDATAARQTLSALRERNHVQIACLYQQSGDLLATYRREDYQGNCPLPEPEQVRYDKGVLVASHTVRLAGGPLGTLILQYDLREIVDRIELYGALVLLALLLSCALTVVLSSRLRSLIAEPILELAGVARSVSASKDYGIRAPKRSQDELGTLADALNQMMEAIQTRDNDLKEALGHQRDALSRLAHLNADLKRSNSDLERFAFMASHDLQEPLRMITSYSQLLVAEVWKGEEGPPSDFVKQIAGGTKRMRDLLADLLAYTEIAGSAEQQLEMVDLNAVVQEVQQALSIGIGEANAEITSDELPVLSAHQGRMASLFQNLIGNAVKYRADRPSRIHVSLDDRSDHLYFAVTDNGIGIRKEYHEKIFVAFQRLHGKSVPGTGIGLAICQRVVERYGGRIWVESEFGTGSQFRFTLPKSMLHRKAVS